MPSLKTYALQKQDQKNLPVKKSRSQRIKEEEFTLCGWNTCVQAFKKRPHDIRRFFFAKERSSDLREVKKWCQSHKLPYRELDNESLNKVAGSVHHEGLVMVVRPVQPVSVHRLIKKGLAKNGLLVALDRVGNTHNVGAILRSCAYFGADGLLMTLEEGQAMLTPSAVRTAEGALEVVPTYDCTNLPSALRDFKSGPGGTFVLGTDPDSKRSLYESDISFPCVVVLGNERDGLSPQVKRRCNSLVSIPGSKAIQSLNVAVATGIVLAHLAQRRTKNDR